MIEIKKEQPDSYYFYLKTEDGNTLLKSIGFPSRKEAEAVIQQLPSLMQNQIAFERQTSHQGQFLFRLKDFSGKILGSSQLYNSEAGMENGIKNLRNSIVSYRGNNL